MGQAKHYHSQSDPNYTQFSNLSPAAARTQHSRLVIRELFAAFAPEFKTLIRTKTFPDDYQQTCTFVTNWLNRRLLRYQEGDREYIARFILSTIAQLDDFSVIDQHQQEDDVNPILLCCLFQATRSYFSDEALGKMERELTQNSSLV